MSTKSNNMHDGIEYIAPGDPKAIEIITALEKTRREQMLQGMLHMPFVHDVSVFFDVPCDQRIGVESMSKIHQVVSKSIFGQHILKALYLGLAIQHCERVNPDNKNEPYPISKYHEAFYYNLALRMLPLVWDEIVFFLKMTDDEVIEFNQALDSEFTEMSKLEAISIDLMNRGAKFHPTLTPRSRLTEFFVEMHGLASRNEHLKGIALLRAALAKYSDLLPADHIPEHNDLSFSDVQDKDKKAHRLIVGYSNYCKKLESSE